MWYWPRALRARVSRPVERLEGARALRSRVSQLVERFEAPRALRSRVSQPVEHLEAPRFALGLWEGPEVLWSYIRRLRSAPHSAMAR